MNNRFAHGETLPVGPVDFLIAPLCFRRAVYVFCGLGDDFLCEVHHALVVGIRLIELEHGELGIPAPAQTLIAEVAVDFVDAIESAHDQSFQIKFGSDSQVEVHVERVVVRDERPRHGAACDGLHHGRFDFDESV